MLEKRDIPFFIEKRVYLLKKSKVRVKSKGEGKRQADRLATK